MIFTSSAIAISLDDGMGMFILDCGGFISRKCPIEFTITPFSSRIKVNRLLINLFAFNFFFFTAI